MVAAWRVSAEITAPSARNARITGRMRAVSASAGKAAAFGRVLSPPMSMMSAPARKHGAPGGNGGGGDRQTARRRKMSPGSR